MAAVLSNLRKGEYQVIGEKVRALMPLWRRALCFVIGVGLIPLGAWMLATLGSEVQPILGGLSFIVGGVWAIYHAFTSANLAR